MDRNTNTHLQQHKAQQQEPCEQWNSDKWFHTLYTFPSQKLVCVAYCVTYKKNTPSGQSGLRSIL